MKHIKKLISLIICLNILLSTSSIAEVSNRVVCDVEIASESSAKVTLRWAEETPTNIRITGWKKVDETTLKIIYDYGNQIPAGWNSKTISGTDYQFPMKIVLQEQDADNLAFTDLPTDYETKYSILNLYNRDIINGYPDGSFKPSNNVTRTEFAKMITKTAQYQLLSKPQSQFTDVTNEFWGTNYIMTLADKAILNGYPGGAFNPNGAITIGEILAVINRTFIFYNNQSDYQYTLQPHWSNEDLRLLTKKNIVRSTNTFYNPYNPNQKATRKDCAILLSRVLETLYETK